MTPAGGHAVDVLCIGHAAWDITLPLPGFPAEDGKVEIPALIESGGGPAANAAWLLSAWGVRCGFAGVVGDDDRGRRVVDEFAAAGTDTSLVEHRPDVPTPLSVILVNQHTGSRTVVNRRVPAAPLALGDVPGPPPRVLLFDGHELPASQAAMDRFPGARTILDAGSLRDGTRVLAGRVEFLVASERFGRQITGLPPLDGPDRWAAAVAALSALNGRPVVITLGRHGLVHGTADAWDHWPAVPATAIDTTAAGDAFHGAFAYGVLTGMSWTDTLRLTTTTAALSVQRLGGRRSFPPLDRVRASMRGQRDDD